MELSPKQFSSVSTPATKPTVTSPAGSKWSDPVGGHRDANAKAKSFEDSWMNQSHHRDAYEHFVWHSDPQRGGEHRMQTYDHVRPGTQKGVPGIVTRRGAFHDFIPNDNISAMAHGEREGADPSFVREENHRKSRLASGYDD